jgi:DNA-binding response OmpR family regulator
VHILLATDADWIVDEVTAALGDDDVRFTVCRDGRVVTAQVKASAPDLAILDLQVGSMGGMAVTMGLRLDESSGALPHVPVLMLLDRAADVHLGRRCGAEGWLIKPLDSLRLRRAADAVAAGGRYTEGLPPGAADVDAMVPLPDAADERSDGTYVPIDQASEPPLEPAAEPAEEEAATAG